MFDRSTNNIRTKKIALTRETNLWDLNIHQTKYLLKKWKGIKPKKQKKKL